MTPILSLTRKRPTTRLTLQPLEERATPAVAIYTAPTQTLTVIAHEGDQIQIDGLSGEPTGYVKVSETQLGATVFSSSTAGQSVRNLIVRFNNIEGGGFTLSADAKLGGNLVITGAKTSQTANLHGTVGGNLVYAGNTLGAFDDVDFEPTAVVGGNMSLMLAGGPNTVRLKGGTIRGNMIVVGSAADDIVELGESGNITINGAASINLGSGNNLVKGKGLAPTIRVRSNFTYLGGAGNDTFDLDGAGAALDVGGDARFILGSPTMFDGNTVALEALRAGRHIVFVGGLGNDTITVTGALEAGCNVVAALNAGDNTFNTNLEAMGTNVIGGSLTYVGGTGFDHLSLDATTIGRNLVVNLGENFMTGQSLFVGLNAPAGVTVYGNVRVNGGSGSDGMLFRRFYVGGNLSVATGAGGDTVTFDDTDVAGVTLVDLGAGDDLIQSELLTGDAGGTLSAATTFGGAFIVKGGDGADTLHLSDDSDANTHIQFGGRAIFIGGNQQDSINNAQENIFKLTGNFNDFDILVGTAVI